MREDLVIIGAGDFAREAMWVAERMNEERLQWNLLGFVDDALAGQTVDGYPVLGDVAWLREYPQRIHAVCAIGTGSVRKRLWGQLSTNSEIVLATLIDPAAIIGRDAAVGSGCIVCAGTVVAIGAKLGRHTIVNLNCTIGHDAQLGTFVTVHPGANISGRVQIGKCSIVGTGAKIIQGIGVADQVILGAGAVVCRDILDPGTYIGVPAKIKE